MPRMNCAARTSPSFAKMAPLGHRQLSDTGCGAHALHGQGPCLSHTMTSTNKASTEIAPKKASLTLRAQISDMQGELASDSALRIALSHGLQVSDLALVLYDSLAPLHGLSDPWRERLICAALLHDLGQVFGIRKHHKNTLALLLEEKAAEDEGTASCTRALVTILPEKERLAIGLVARYHRKAWPSTLDPLFAGLSLQERLGVSVCASILRIADALDVLHTNEVQSLRVIVDDASVVLELHGANGPCATLEEHALRARMKGELFMDLFGRELTWRLC